MTLKPVPQEWIATIVDSSLDRIISVLAVFLVGSAGAGSATGVVGAVDTLR